MDLHPSQVHPLPHAAEHSRALRRRQTPAEEALWAVLRNRKFHGVKFRRQAPVGRFIVDFLSLHPPLIIELDGDIHRFSEDNDADRTASIQHDYAMPLLRFSNEDILTNIDSVLEKIAAFLSPPHP